jgi:NADH:quinone reductase (non-electrogenic)
MSEAVPRVVIVGGGFGGLAAGKALRKTDAEVILIDRQNHHLFQPLLYQVATSVLSPGQIASPIRGILGKQANTTVILGEVTGVDADRRRVFVDSVDRSDVAIEYDYLILATGASHSYFGHDEFEPFAPGLKSLADAVAIRNRILQAFEQAEAEEDPKRHHDLLTFVLVGAGPTGVEMAGAMAELVRRTLRSEFRRIDPTSARVVLVDAGKRVLGAFPETLAAAAMRRLEKLGVEVRLGHGVDHIDADGVSVAGEHIASSTVIWTAGVAPSPAGKWLKAATDRAGRVRVQPDLTVKDHPEIFVVGRHRVARSGRSSSTRRRSSRDAAGPVCSDADSPTHQGASRLSTISLLRQRKHGGRRQGLRRAAQRPGEPQRLSRVDGMGSRASRIPGAVEPSRERLRAVGVDVCHGTAGFAAHRESSRVSDANPARNRHAGRGVTTTMRSVSLAGGRCR